MTLDDAARTLLKNPFAVEVERWSAARDVLEGSDVASEIRSRLRDGDTLGAKRVVLATGHLAALAHPDVPEKVLASNVLPDSVLRGLPRTRGSYLRVVMAAARARRALLAIVGTSEAMRRVRIATWAACFGDSLMHALMLAQVIHDHDILILGETGTGKEAIAHAVQEGAFGGDDGSPAPRSALNAAAVPDTLIESELFGHAKGAFTGATENRVGRIRGAHGGSFFLDEVGDLPITTQVKLLRVIETDEVQPLGSDKSHRAHVRYIAATHKDLEAMVDAGQYRRDLHQRLAGSVIRLPPLRERPEDIQEIGRKFIERYLHEDLGETRARVDAWLGGRDAHRHAWPGNVRELQNALRNLLLGLEAGISVNDSSVVAAPRGEDLPSVVRECVATMKDVEDWYLERVLTHTDDNFAQAARILEVDRTTVRRRARKLRSRRPK